MSFSEKEKAIVAAVCRKVLSDPTRFERVKRTPRVSSKQIYRMVQKYMDEKGLLQKGGRPPTVNAVKLRGVRLDEETEQGLAKLVNEWQCTHSEAIRRVLREYIQIRNEVAHGVVANDSMP